MSESNLGAISHLKSGVSTKFSSPLLIVVHKLTPYDMLTRAASSPSISIFRVHHHFPPSPSLKPKKGVFDVKSFYNVLIPNDSNPFPQRYIWWSREPLRVTFFAWFAALGKIFTVDNLRKQKIIIVDWCCLHKKSGKTVGHLLLHFEIASALWYSIFCLFGLAWVMPH